MVVRRKDLTGKTFGDWTVIRFSDVGKDRSAYWICRCVCGEERRVRGGHLSGGRSSGCGCSADKKFAASLKSHGMSRSPEYQSWKMMKHRCSNDNYTQYEDYGGRGIKVCERWESFESFYKDMGDRPKGTTLDRIDHNGDYSPENCRWATTTVQNNNSRHVRLLTHAGETMSVSAWADRIGITQQALQGRLKNWSVDRALSTPANDNMRR